MMSFFPCASTMSDLLHQELGRGLTSPSKVQCVRIVDRTSPVFEYLI
jgi:hypothetical protein